MAVLLALGFAFGGAPAVAGLSDFAQSLLPGMAAEALPQQQENKSAHLAVAGLPDTSPYAPQVLFPVPSHSFPDWLLHPGREAALPAPARHPVIAICIDDLGEDLAGTDRAMALPKPVALSFLPYAEASGFLAAEAARKGHEVLAHVPMDAAGHDPGPMTLETGADDIAQRLIWNLARVPSAIGINNHEGSRFTADAVSLIPVAQVLAARHLFFFDSRTGGDSKVVAVARHFGVATASRDIFLDDTASEAAIREQLQALVAAARAGGVAIAIGHPHDLTLKILSAWLSQDHGVTLVPLTEAIRRKSERLLVARQ